MYRYGSGKTILTERLIDGRILFRDLRANGVPVVEEHEEQNTPSFAFEIDGSDLSYGWESVSFDSEPLKDGGVRGTLVLDNARVLARLTLETVAGEEGFFLRTLKLENRSDRPMRIGNIVPFKGRVFRSPRSYQTTAMLRDLQDPAFSIGHFYSDGWGTEGNFHWDALTPNTGMFFGSSRGRSGHNHPFLAARDELYGGFFLCQLAWSANWRASAFGRCESDTDLTVSIGPESPNPARILLPGESFDFPPVLFGMNADGFDELVCSLHQFQRNHVLKATADEQPVIINHWGNMRHELSEEKLMQQIDLGASVGGELFLVDAGWFGRKGHNWYSSTGDWVAGERLPNDLFPVFDYARSKGMKVGLWAEIETAGSESLLTAEHPDWFLTRYGKRVERLLDLTNPEAASYVEQSVMELIERYRLDLFRLDYNTDALEGGFRMTGGAEENTLYRHVEAIWKIFERVRERFPNVQLENCSAGGGRTDLGMNARFTTTWVSDWMLLPRTVRILNGMSIVLPPDRINRQFGVSMEGAYPGSLEASLTASVMGHPSISGFAPTSGDVNPEALETVRKYMEVYKNEIRPMHRDLMVYHHTPELPGISGEGWCILEYGTRDRSRGAVAVWRQYASSEDTVRVRLRGTDPSAVYSVRMLPVDDTFRMTGRELTDRGLEFRLDTALTSRLVLLKKIPDGSV
ncbi:MAG: alpha-galactosidase [Clostridia bacterium]|nr:alpha-galactosidase [Clostridia bacterium]